MNWVGGTLYPYPGVKCPWGQDTVPAVSCPRGQDKPGGGGDILPRGKVSLGTRYSGDKKNRYTGTFKRKRDHTASLSYPLD